ncbi:MAG: sugar phosphate isomerase/epimerase [Candidatus Omnitrophica bacterium]|nr:sugar phosphate isomerase/epimerase [Candidatus Omnitrophota bacterium]MCM8822238.1 sugar phosphate isomerase/epimerase [Candidatus Omnitrophota bacterium]MCM8824651.1 sugar phosphate isomerase/epimerase [Candidatus Omnitrophota bacterium]
MNKSKLGIIVGAGENLDEIFQKVRMFNFPLCQMSFIAENMSLFDPLKIKMKAAQYEIEIFSVFLLFKGQIFNLKDGPATMGFVAPDFRAERLKLALEFSDFVREIGTKYIVSHVGFIPDDEQDPVYQSFIPVMREFVEKCRSNRQFFCFETGQELPSTLKRTINDIGLENTGINLDPANLILYGKANPIDAIEIFGRYVKSIHGKDGLWPNRDEYLGKEVPVGQGMVNFPLLLRRLKNLGFEGPIIIEREISGERQIQDIKRAIEFFSKIL